VQATGASGKGWTYSQPWDDGRVFYHCVTVAGPFMGGITMMPKAFQAMVTTIYFPLLLSTALNYYY